MHIPDGYLSPSTCAVLYVGAAAGWYSALRRLKRMLLTRVVPLISVFAAFAFVVMMFNLPLPGGTTGHALGVTIATIVLGPAGGILSISIALVIQALFFGDGGISTLGANCFNMAIIASLVAYASYRMIAAGSGIASRRRVVAAAIAGYLAVNAAALAAAFEFGIQPMLFHDAHGTPLYAPYPLSVAIPAMMIGHLTFAGLAEAVITAGVVAYLQAADPALLRSTSGLPADAAVESLTLRPATGSLRTAMDRRGGADAAHAAGNSGRGDGVGRMVAVAAGESGSRASSRRQVRRPGGAGSGSRRPREVGEVMDRAFPGVRARVRQEPCLRLFSFCHVCGGISAGRLAVPATLPGAPPPDRIPGMKRGFLESTFVGFARVLSRAMMSEELARRRGLLQALDPRVRVVGLFSLVLAVTLSKKISVVAALFVLGIVIAMFSQVSLLVLAKRVWLVVLGFTGVIAIPATFVTPGNPVATLGFLTITEQGLRTAAMLILRVETAVTFTTLLILCTPWAHVLKALRAFRLPKEAIAMLAMTHRYVFLLVETASQMLESRRSRTVGILPPAEQRRMAARTAGVLLSKSIELSNEVYLAMQARGFRGDVQILSDFRMGAWDYLGLAAFLLAGSVAVWMGR